MAEENETPVVNSEGANDTPDQQVNPEGQEGQQPEAKPTVEKSEYDALQKKLQGLEQERNMLRNKNKDYEKKAVDTDDLESMKSAYSELLREKEEREEAEKANDERKEAESFRDRVIADYPEAVQKAAKRLIKENKNNLIWEGASSWDDARSQLTPQLDALKEVVMPEDNSDNNVHANNPGNAQVEQKFKDLSLEDMRKVLPRADAR